MELTPDITVGTASLPPSIVATMPPRTVPRTLPPPFDSTFAWMPPSRVETTSPAPMPESALPRGGSDTLLSAPWFQDAADASEWRAVAEERRAVESPAAPDPASSPVPVWLVAAVVSAGVVLSATATGAVALVVSAVVLLT